MRYRIGCDGIWENYCHGSAPNQDQREWHDGQIECVYQNRHGNDDHLGSIGINCCESITGAMDHMRETGDMNNEWWWSTSAQTFGFESFEDSGVCDNPCQAKFSEVLDNNFGGHESFKEQCRQTRNPNGDHQTPLRDTDMCREYCNRHEVGLHTVGTDFGESLPDTYDDEFRWSNGFHDERDGRKDLGGNFCRAGSRHHLVRRFNSDHFNIDHDAFIDYVDDEVKIDLLFNHTFDINDEHFVRQLLHAQNKHVETDADPSVGVDWVFDLTIGQAEKDCQGDDCGTPDRITHECSVSLVETDDRSEWDVDHVLKVNDDELHKMQLSYDADYSKTLNGR